MIGELSIALDLRPIQSSSETRPPTPAYVRLLTAHSHTRTHTPTHIATLSHLLFLRQLNVIRDDCQLQFDNYKKRACIYQLLFTSDKGGGVCFCPCSFVCLSVCLLERLLKNACMDLDEMLRVDRCRDMDELINV